MLVFMLVVGAAAAGAAGVLRLAWGRSLIPARRPGDRRRRAVSPGQGRTVGLSVVLGVVVLVVTRWPAAALMAVAAGVLWPRIVGGAAVGRRQLRMIEALATWTESLRDTTEGGAGLEQAIPATVPGAPELLRAPLRDLAARLDGRVPLPAALTYFADDLGDPAADMVVAALSLNARQRAGGLKRILTSLAQTSRSELEMRRKVEHQRRSIRRESQQVAAGVLGLVLVQALLAPGWVRPYDTVVGQLVLVVVAAVFTAAFARMRALAQPVVPGRFLATAQEVTEVASYKPRVGVR